MCSFSVAPSTSRGEDIPSEPTKDIRMQNQSHEQMYIVLSCHHLGRDQVAKMLLNDWSKFQHSVLIGFMLFLSSPPRVPSDLQVHKSVMYAIQLIQGPFAETKVHDINTTIPALLRNSDQGFGA